MNLVELKVRFLKVQDTTNKLGMKEFEKLARIRVRKCAKFTFITTREGNAFFEEAKAVYERVHPDGSEIIEFDSQK